MFGKRFILFALISLCVYCNVASVGLSSLGAIFGFITKAVSIFSRLKKDLDEGKGIFDSVVDSLQSPQQRQQKAIEALASKLDDLSNEVLHFQDAAEKKLNHLDALLTRLPNVIQQIELKNRIRDSITFINKQQRRFAEFTDKNKHFNNITLMGFSSSMINPTSGIESQLDVLFAITVPNPQVPIGDTVLGGLNSERETDLDDCSGAYYSQLSLFDLYDLLITTELVGLSVITYAYGIESIFYNTTVQTELETAEAHVRERVTNYHKSFTRTMMISVPRTIPQCQPIKKHIRDETYIEMTDLFQGVITNDWGLMKEMSCAGSCEELDTRREDVCVLGEGKPCLFFVKPCAGRMHSCISLLTTKVCLSEDKAKRYERFTDENGKVYGHKNNVCRWGNEQQRTWWWWDFYRCEQCACVCDNTDAQTKSPQIISLLETRSDAANNKVITGLRLRRERVYGQSYILYIEVKEGTLYGNGYIDESSERWVPAQNLQKQIKKIKEELYQERSLHQYRKGDRFTTIHKENNAIYLDNAIPESGRCIIGIRFVQIGIGIAISVESAAFDYDTGKLVANSFIWTTPSAENKSELQLINVDNPLLANAPNVQDSTTDQFVRFNVSSFEKDAAQSTVPFLHARAVEVFPSVPLGGAGFFHTGVDGYGGYVRIKVFSIDYDQLLKDGALNGTETNQV